MRFTAPKHATGVTLSTGPHSVVDGILEVPDDTSAGDIGGLYANGFQLAPQAAPAPVAPSPAPEPEKAPEQAPAAADSKIKG